MTTEMTQSEIDDSHLGILRVLWFAWGGLTMLGGCMFGGFALLGGAMGAVDPGDAQLQDGATAMTGLFGVLSFVVLGWGALNIFTGVSLGQRSNRLLVLIMSIVTLLNFPLGTALGGFTLLVLFRPSVQARYR